VIWVKTEQGRAEMQTRALVKERARRNLLLMIDGVRSQDLLLSSLTGIDQEDFQELRRLNLIAPAPGTASLAENRALADEPAANAAPEPAAAARGELGYGHFTAALTKLISDHLGLRGLTLTLAVERAQTGEELTEVGRRVIDAIRQRKGEQAAAEATKILYR
jgi:hypothetical protein